MKFEVGDTLILKLEAGTAFPCVLLQFSPNTTYQVSYHVMSDQRSNYKRQVSK